MPLKLIFIDIVGDIVADITCGLNLKLCPNEVSICRTLSVGRISGTFCVISAKIIKLLLSSVQDAKENAIATIAFRSGNEINLLSSQTKRERILGLVFIFSPPYRCIVIKVLTMLILIEIASNVF